MTKRVTKITKATKEKRVTKTTLVAKTKKVTKTTKTAKSTIKSLPQQRKLRLA